MVCHMVSVDSQVVARIFKISKLCFLVVMVMQ